MGFFSFIIKSYILVLILRNVMTRQELYLNPLGKIVASLTEPIFGTVLKSIPHEKSKKYTVFLIAILTVMLGLIYWTFSGQTFLGSIVGAVDDVLRFLMVFYVVSIILGSLLNTVYQTSIYTTFFYRIGLFWVKLARSIINIPGNGITVVAVILVFIVYVIVDSVFQVIFSISFYGNLNLIGAILFSVKYGLFALIDLLGTLTWLIIIRALISWVSPDPYNPLVQLIVALTEPVMGPFRRLIPTIGIIDISPIIAIFIIEFLRVFLKRFIGLLF
ncbi:YggT family protein [Deferribacter autotrophicus]|uniref:YggT family protein n=1 Tax=Deferribacter autotrophicus TaxID=500465 RepID=A0A5A8F7T6_9BACT|nr:YggT family protein [Deferribacter autotrophicus]KAA0259183.1 YggT family protein [Deferribacter autotrophicus]